MGTALDGTDTTTPAPGSGRAGRCVEGGADAVERTSAPEEGVRP